MFESLMETFESKYPGKTLLTIEEVAIALDCQKRVIYNWIRRPDPESRPPRIQNGKWIRIPVRGFIQWLIKDQANTLGCHS